MKTYRGIRDPGCRVLVLKAPAGPSFDDSDASRDGVDAHHETKGAGGPRHGDIYELTIPAELLSKPAGPFDWGGGTETSGTHYLALAILADLLGSSDRAGIKALLPFLRRFLARLPEDGFEISDTIFFALFSAIAGAARAEALAHAQAGAANGSHLASDR